MSDNYALTGHRQTIKQLYKQRHQPYINGTSCAKQITVHHTKIRTTATIPRVVSAGVGINVESNKMF